MFTQIKINKFRAINDETFKLGKYVTMFAGWNGTGKSTVLALMANSTELKREQGLTYTGKQFRAEFNEILKGSEEFDCAEPNLLEVVYEYNGKERTKTFRTTWQNRKNRSKRYRVIPKETCEGRSNEAKFEFPVIYLGLSRLYPIGEFDDKFVSSKDLPFKKHQDDQDDEQWFKKQHIEILSSNSAVKIKEVSSLDIKSTHKEKIGVNTDKYDWKTNSSGQDNLGQILLSILSFKKIKREMGDNYKGGLLIIDELEASLHPKAQEKLLELLISESRSNNIQVLFTTHSLTLIKKFCERNKKKNQNLKHYYFTNSICKLKVYEDYDYEKIEEDLLLPLYCGNNTSQKIIVYTEDEESRWFLKKIIGQSTEKLEYRDVTIGCNSLIDLMNVEPAFEDYLVVFDGDLEKSSEKRIKKCKDNYVILPTYSGKFCSPEKLLYDFINSDKSERYFEEESKKIPRVKPEYFKEHDLPKSGSKKKRDLYKEWFSVHKELFEDSNIYEYWKKQNIDLVEKFLQEFKEVYNNIAKKEGIELIQELTG